MKIKPISCVLIVAFLNFLGCASIQFYTVSEYKQFEKEKGNPDDIYVKTKEDEKYYFSAPYYYFQYDTLYGMGDQEGRKVALSNIESIEIRTSLSTETTVLVGIIVIPLIIMGISAIKWNSNG